jgi:hypothetical protein
MNPDTLTTSTVKLSLYDKATGKYVPVTNTAVSCDSPCYTVTLDPYGTSSTLLAANAKYEVTVTTGAKDATGNALAQNKAWTFTTGPTVSSTTPTSGATGVRRGSSPTATFSEEMNPDTLTTSTVKLSVYNKKKGRYVLVSNTTVRCDSPCYTVTLDPYGTSSTLLAANAKYKVTITTGAKDATGDALAQNKAWTFTTGLGG